MYSSVNEGAKRKQRWKQILIVRGRQHSCTKAGLRGGGKSWQIEQAPITNQIEREGRGEERRGVASGMRAACSSCNRRIRIICFEEAEVEEEGESGYRYGLWSDCGCDALAATWTDNKILLKLHINRESEDIMRIL